MIEAVIYRSLTRILIADLIRRLIYTRPGSTAIHSSEAGCLRYSDIDRIIIIIVSQDLSLIQIGRSYIDINCDLCDMFSM